MIELWDLPKQRTHIAIDEELKNNIIKLMKIKKFPLKLIRRLRRQRIKISTIELIFKNLDISSDIFKKNISWIGGGNGYGLSNPKLPFNLSSREGARFIAAITNDGCLSNTKSGYGRLMYDNFEKELRDSVIQDYLKVFGGKPEEIAFRNYEKKKFLEFTSIIRDIMFLILKHKGSKAETNLKVPSFILKDQKNIFGWIEQTIADEGEVKYEPHKYRRSIIWRRSLDVSHLFNKQVTKDIPLRRLPKSLQSSLLNQKCNLIESEKRMLEMLGIQYRIYNLGVYPTEKGKIRTRWQISITKRENLLKLRKLIKIPLKKKDQKFDNICNEFERYKEPLRIKKAIIKLAKHNKPITSSNLKKAMNYRNTSTATHWIKRFEKENLIKKVRDSEYSIGNYRKPAEYRLISVIK